MEVRHITSERKPLLSSDMSGDMGADINSISPLQEAAG